MSKQKMNVSYSKKFWERYLSQCREFGVRPFPRKINGRSVWGIVELHWSQADDFAKKLQALLDEELI